MSSNYYQPNRSLVQAEQLRWDNWGAICELLGDLMGEGKIRGVAITDNNIVRETPDEEAHRVGLWIPAIPSAIIASENDYIVKDSQGNISVLGEPIFISLYNSVS